MILVRLGDMEGHRDEPAFLDGNAVLKGCRLIVQVKQPQCYKHKHQKATPPPPKSLVTIETIL